MLPKRYTTEKWTPIENFVSRERANVNIEGTEVWVTTPYHLTEMARLVAESNLKIFGGKFQGIKDWWPPQNTDIEPSSTEIMHLSSQLTGMLRYEEFFDGIRSPWGLFTSVEEVEELVASIELYKQGALQWQNQEVRALFKQARGIYTLVRARVQIRIECPSYK